MHYYENRETCNWFIRPDLAMIVSEESMQFLYETITNHKPDNKRFACLWSDQYHLQFFYIVAVKHRCLVVVVNVIERRGITSLKPIPTNH